MGKRRDLVKRLRQQMADYFRTKGYATSRCGYILEEYGDWRNNIILREIADYIEDRKRLCEKNRVPFPMH